MNMYLCITHYAFSGDYLLFFIDCLWLRGFILSFRYFPGILPVSFLASFFCFISNFFQFSHILKLFFYFPSIFILFSLLLVILFFIYIPLKINVLTFRFSFLIHFPFFSNYRLFSFALLSLFLYILSPFFYYCNDVFRFAFVRQFLSQLTRVNIFISTQIVLTRGNYLCPSGCPFCNCKLNGNDRMNRKP